LVSRKTNTPETRIVTAGTEKEREAGALLTKRGSVSVLPQVPETEELEGSLRASGNARWRAVGVEQPHVGVSGVDETHHVPEAPGEGTLEEDVVHHFKRLAAHGASGLRCRENLLPQER
jgi:hypothetical protein